MFIKKVERSPVESGQSFRIRNDTNRSNKFWRIYCKLGVAGLWKRRCTCKKLHGGVGGAV